jgi:carbon monoxide dehydrogenase subunit G
MRDMRQGGGARLHRRPTSLAVPAALALLALLAPLESAWPAAAAGRPAIPAGVLSPIAVSVADLGNSTMRLDGSFTVDCPAATAWSVLTDYDHIQKFVTSMRKSRVKERGDGFLLVEQESVAKLFLFHRTLHVLLKVVEKPLQSIAFDDVAKTSFARYTGSWTLQEVAGGLEVAYRLTVQGGLVGMTPRGSSQQMVRSLLEQVRAEIGRRAAAL